MFKRQNEVVAPVGRDGLAREFGGEDGLEDLEGVGCNTVKHHSAALSTAGHFGRSFPWLPLDE